MAKVDSHFYSEIEIATALQIIYAAETIIIV